MSSRKNEIYRSFTEHRILSVKYGITKNEIPNNVNEAINCDIPIISAIALIIENLESNRGVNTNRLYQIITNHLNTKAL